MAISAPFYGFSHSTIIPQLITLDVITAAVVVAAAVDEVRRQAAV